MTFTFHDDRKRHRGPGSSNEDGDSDNNRHATGHRSNQAERKRELERNRRHVINVRFAELDNQLQRTSPRADGKQFHEGSPSDASNLASVKGRRIDKEAVLKEAIQRLALKENEASAANARIEAMAAEIHNLRAEKVELREDKTYLRGELEAMRAEVKRLRSDNVHLMQVISKISALKVTPSQPTNPTREPPHGGKSVEDTAMKPVSDDPNTPSFTLAVSPSIVRALVPPSSQPNNNISTPNREEFITPVIINKDSLHSLNTTMTDIHSSDGSSKSADIGTTPTNDSALPQDVFSFQSADEIADLFANFTPSTTYLDDITNYDATGNDFRSRAVPLTQSQTSPEMARAATIAATTIAARTHNSSHHSALAMNDGNTMNDLETSSMVLSLPGESGTNPSNYHVTGVTAQAQEQAYQSTSQPVAAPSVSCDTTKAPGNINASGSDGKNVRRSGKGKNGRFSDVACCV